MNNESLTKIHDGLRAIAGISESIVILSDHFYAIGNSHVCDKLLDFHMRLNTSTKLIQDGVHDGIQHDIKRLGDINAEILTSVLKQKVTQ